MAESIKVCQILFARQNVPNKCLINRAGIFLETKAMTVEKFVKVGENKIRYLEDGQSDDTIVLIHGLGASAERWEYVIPYLRKKYRLIVPDLIGFGYSDKPAVDYTLEFFTKFLSDFLETIGIKKTAIIGSSLGGQIVAEFTIKNKESINKMILVSPSGINPRLSPAMETYGLAMLYPDHQNAHEAFKMMAGPNKEIESHIVEDFIKRMKMPNAKMVYLSTLLGLRNAEPLTEKLHKISIPTMIVWGSNDSVIPSRYSKFFVSSIKGCQFVEMNGCGHAPFAEEPAKFSEIALEFLDGHAGSSNTA